MYQEHLSIITRVSRLLFYSKVTLRLREISDLPIWIRTKKNREPFLFSNFFDFFPMTNSRIKHLFAWCIMELFGQRDARRMISWIRSTDKEYGSVYGVVQPFSMMIIKKERISFFFSRNVKFNIDTWWLSMETSNQDV